ncbi:MAG TPA: MG2 domain-containing protein, partial [Chitinophagales bacterium]|nr:MG2 domain-containing protein [Chitinophagales bacterium]
MNKPLALKSSFYTGAALIALLILNVFLLFAFQTNRATMAPIENYDAYDKLWSEVDTLESKGLTKSALEKVNTIYLQAKKTDNAPQVLKSLIYTVKYKQVLEEGGFEKALLAFETEINTSHFPTKNILQSAAAELYWSYYEQNRWRFSNRTQTSSFEQDDISTWSIEKIVSRVTTLYTASLQHTDSLQQTSIEPFASILEKGNMPLIYRPTLYDFLAHRAIDFFMNDEAYVTQPAYKFNISGEEVFQPTEKFVSLKIETKDSTSGKFLALHLLQELLLSHLRDQSPEALVDIELKRFQFLRTNSVYDLKDSLYLQALQHLEQRYADDSASGPVSLAIAQFYVERSNDYQPPLITDHHWDKKTALSYCDKVISRFPATNAAKNCKALRGDILRKNISLITEQVNLPDQPFRGLVEYRNVKNIYFRIIKNTSSLQEKVVQLEQEKEFAIYLQEPVLKSWSQTFTDLSDYQTHGAEIKIPSLPLGSYIILGSDNETFSSAEGGLLKATTTISNISYISKRDKDHYNFYVLNRESGKPIAGATAKILSQQYDNRNRTYRFVEIGKYTADVNGYFEVPASTGNQNFRVEFSSGNDQLMADDYFYLYRYNEEKQKSNRTIFFTDRSIYRPGQTIYFKGIMLENEDDKNSLKTNSKSTVEFYDVNGQKIHSLDLVTNNYGSFQGSFTAPSSGLNGEMSIRNSTGSVSISVEEYKRPRFEVVFDTLKGSWRLNENITVKGTAKSYAGANIDGASVSYRVVRQARFPIWYYGMKRGGYDRFTQEMEIVNGTTTTDANGAFSVSFIAIPDLKIPPKEKPQFDYKVIADVIDITGETHSSETIVTVGYVSLNIAMDIPETVSKDSLNRFEIDSKNLSGIFEPVQGTITVSSLQQPDRIFRDRLWKRPDQFVMSKEEYYKSFPNDVYDNENDFTTWSKKAVAITQSFNTASSRLFSLPASLSPGKYELELTAKDKYGEEIKVKKYFTVYASKDKEIPLLQSLWNSEIPQKAEAGTTVPFQLGTSQKEVYVIYEVEARNFSERKVLFWKKGKENITLPITENFKGGVTVNAVAVKHGRVYSLRQT